MEKRKIITCCLSTLFAFVFSTSIGQKKITWNDFQGSPELSDSINSFLDYDLSYKYQKVNINDTTLIYFQATATIDQSNSWVKEENKNQKELLLNQLKATTLEAYRIKTQIFLDSVEHPLMIDSIFPLILDDLNTDINTIQQNYNQKSVSELEQDLKSSEQNLNGRSLHSIPSFSPSKLGLGIHLGIGASLFSENINHYFTHPLILTLGGDIKTDKFNYNLSGTVGWNKTKKEFTNEYEWKDDFGTSTLSFETTIGYNLKISKLKVVPFIGLSYFGIITLTGQKQTALGKAVNQYNKYTTVTPTIGVMFDYNTKTTIKLSPSYSSNSKKHSELNIRLKLSVSPIDFDNNINGTLFNSTIGISTFNRPIKLN